MALIDELRKAVDRDGRSRRQIALASGIHPSTFTRFMTGHRGLSIETVESLASALHLEVRLVAHQGPEKAKPKQPGKKIRG